jgi:epoxyqueuosine reductase
MHVLTEDPRPVIRGTAAWALGKIQGDQAEKALKRAKERENDAEVLGEIDRSLNMIDHHVIS